MTASFFAVAGDPASPEALLVPKARDLALRLEAGHIDFATIVECRVAANGEWVVFDVGVEVPQLRSNPIQPSERIAARFTSQDNAFPLVHALRKDFPRVPHLNLDFAEYPRSLCLYADRYEELKRDWTALRFVQRVREWLALSSRGELHQDDQPLEPLLAASASHIVLPRTAWDASGVPERLYVTAPPGGNVQRQFYLATATPAVEALPILLSVHLAPARTHGVIHRHPSTLADLATLLEETGFDLLGELRTRLTKWHAAALGERLLVVVVFPVRRERGGEVQSYDAWAFLLVGTNADPSQDLRIRSLGQRIGLWDLTGGQIGYLLPTDTTRRGGDVGVEVLNVSWELSRSTAAVLNGHTSPTEARIVAIGLGALGSQVLLHLARSGFGRWTLVDNDYLLPHNAARHALDGHFVGWNKAEAMSLVANTIASDESPPFFALPLDALAAGARAEEFSRALIDADAILDISTSIAVARMLANDAKSGARRASLFLTPTGEDLVLIAEDKERALPLDALEMQYYRATMNDPALRVQLIPNAQRHRYGQTCRDITSQLPQRLVALHAATAAGALQRALETPAPTLAIWRADGVGNVRRVDVDPKPIIRQQIGTWTVVTDQGLTDRLSTLRAEKLPNETGGVLLGSFDVSRSILYLADALPSPPDSEEWPTLYIRGSKGLREQVERAREVTHDMVVYVGEWHSHPQGVRAAASNDDLKVFAWLTSLMDGDGLPAAMMIVGDPGQISCFVGEIHGDESLLRGERP